MFGLLDYIKLGAGLLAGIALFSVYDGVIDDPLVRREALSGYVLKAEKDALASRLIEERRRASAAAQAMEEHRKRLDAALRAEEQASEKLEAEISENERLLEERGRACRIDLDDIDFLLRKSRQKTE